MLLFFSKYYCDWHKWQKCHLNCVDKTSPELFFPPSFKSLINHFRLNVELCQQQSICSAISHWASVVLDYYQSRKFSFLISLLNFISPSEMFVVIKRCHLLRPLFVSLSANSSSIQSLCVYTQTCYFASQHDDLLINKGVISQVVLLLTGSCLSPQFLLCVHSVTSSPLHNGPPIWSSFCCSSRLFK